MTASLSSSTRLVNTSAELAAIARISNAVINVQPGLRPPRRPGARDRTEFICAAPPRRFAPLAVPRSREVPPAGLEVPQPHHCRPTLPDCTWTRSIRVVRPLRRFLPGLRFRSTARTRPESRRRLAAVLQPQRGDEQSQRTGRRDHGAAGVLGCGLQRGPPRQQVAQHARARSPAPTPPSTPTPWRPPRCGPPPADAASRPGTDLAVHRSWSGRSAPRRLGDARPPAAISRSTP